MQLHQTQSLSFITGGLPRDVSIQLNATDHKVLELLAHMLSNFKKRNPEKREYICPGEKWIAHRINRSRQSISESVQKLQTLGIIRILHRRQVRQQWQTNLYKYGYWLLRAMGRMKEAVLSRFSPCRVFPTHSKRTALISIRSREAKDSFNNQNPPQRAFIPRDANPLQKIDFSGFYERHPELTKEDAAGG